MAMVQSSPSLGVGPAAPRNGTPALGPRSVYRSGLALLFAATLALSLPLATRLLADDIPELPLTAATQKTSVPLTDPFKGPAFPQTQSDRPPWARSPKSNSSSTPPSNIPATNTTPPPIVHPTPPADTSTSDEQSQRGRIRVTVNLVNVLASVLDEHNRPVPDLPREAFHLFEEGVEQKIEVFEQETQQPLDLALMVDTSLSAHKEITFEQEAALRFIRQVLRPTDRVSIFALSEDVVQLAAYTDNISLLQSALHRMPAGAGTSIYDGLLLGSRTLERRGEDRRRVIVLVTDAGETTSNSDFDAARKAAVRSSALLYTIVIRPVKNESGRNTAGEHALETITDTMGGAMFYPDAIQELDAIFDRINRELRTQYRLGYYPNPRGPANSYRTIEVKISAASLPTTDGTAPVTIPGTTYQVRHRKTYLTGAQ
jgi:Ca-activated chloride channel homolog